MHLHFRKIYKSTRKPHMNRIGLGVAMAMLFTGAVVAQDFPSRSVRLIVPYPPSGAADIIGRMMGPPLSRGIGQSVIIENRAGANTVIGAEVVARAPADGHTLL